jgi:demethylmenaquinone methyltransferase/2-methoxy-6-polyprenyl-1,4-benzoquinol methylase
VPEDKVEFLVCDAYQLPLHLDPFSAAFAGFWFSHVPKARQREFLLGLSTLLEPGARVVLLDNRYVEGSSSPVTEHDADGNTYQTRRLKDGSTHRVLKNFPSEAELRALILNLGDRATFTRWQYFWAFEYLVVGH